MTYGIDYKQGDIVLVNVPFTNLVNSKQRPALVISNDNYNSIVDDIVICGITSNLKDNTYSVLLDSSDMIEGHLNCLSIIKADKIFAIEKKIIKGKLGKVNNYILNQTKEALWNLLYD